MPNPTITFTVGDTDWSDNGGQFTLTQADAMATGPLFKLPGYAFHALQYGHDGRDLGPFLIDGSARDLSPLMGDFARNAALIAKLDMAEMVPFDCLVYRFDLVLRGRRQTYFENKPEGH